MIDRLGEELPLDLLVDVRLGAGWNRILLKLYALDPDREVQVRILGKDGRPFPGLDWERGRILHPPVAAPAPFAGIARPVPSLQRLREWVAARPQAASLRAALASACREQALGDEALTAIRQATDLQPGDAWLWMERARCELSARHLSPARRDSTARLGYQRVLGLQAGFVPALLGLASIEEESKRHTEAAELYQQALAALQPVPLSARSSHLVENVEYWKFVQTSARFFARMRR